MAVIRTSHDKIIDSCRTGVSRAVDRSNCSCTVISDSAHPVIYAAVSPKVLPDIFYFSLQFALI